MAFSVGFDVFDKRKFSHEFPVLGDGGLRLEPVGDIHLDRLFDVTPQETFDLFTIRPSRWTRECFREYTRGLASQGFFGLVAVVNGEIAGLSTYMDIRAQHLGLEIGHTFLAQTWRGTWVNPVMKRLMIGFALEDLGAHRVQLKTDLRNLRSQKAMQNCGFSKEGTLRQHLVMPDGYVRDTVMFSVVQQDWPLVKERLIELEAARRDD